MRIGLDHAPAATHWPGVGRYARELVRALVRLDERPELALLDVGRAPRIVPREALGLDGARGVARRRLALPHRALGLLARVGFPAERLVGGVDLFHRVLPGEPPLGRAVPRVQAVAEPPAPGSPDAARLARALAEPAHALAFSTWTAGELARRFELPAERVHVVPVGCDHWARDVEPCAERGPPFELAVLGRVDRARRPLALARAVERLARRGLDARVTWIGAPGDAAGELAGAEGERVRWRRAKDEAELGPLLARAALLVHLADAEGTAVTPLEACSLGADVVASRVPPFAEALGGLDVGWVENAAVDEDPDVLADALAARLARVDDEGARAGRRARAARFTWAEHARLTVALWRRILGR